MTVFVFGNPDLKIDSLPIKILPDLQVKFPEIEFKILDPNEEWGVPEDLIVIDSVVGIKKITIFENLKDFIPAPNISMHDFDAYANLRFLEKLGKLKNIKIIGVPSNFEYSYALWEVSDAIRKHFLRRKVLRLPDFDYSKAGYYFVTICTKDRKCLFGKVTDGEMVLNDLGRTVEKCCLEASKHYKNIEVDMHIVMPNHMHGIIVIKNDVVVDSNVGAQHAAPLQINVKPGSLGAIVRSFKNASTKYIHEKFIENFSWQRNYYDHVIRDEKSLEKIREYIQNNPLQWELDEENPKNFQKQ